MAAFERDDSAAVAARTPIPFARLREVAITHEGADAATPASVTFDVAAGEVVLLLGPSGSGKSTLTLALNGLIPHALPATVTGAIDVGGVDAAQSTVAELSTRVAMVFQDPDAQLVTGTLLDEVAFGPENLRLPVEDVLERTEVALRRVGLWDRRHDGPDRLSGGGRQRLAIACALAMGSPLLVLDEPTANLDPAGIEDVYTALGELVAAGDRGIVLVEHNLDAAMGLVDRVVVLDHDGRVIADGPADRVLRHRAAEMHDLGVWLPTSTLAALRLRSAGYALDPLPLTPAELAAALDAAPGPEDSAADPSNRRSAPRSGTGDVNTPANGRTEQESLPANGQTGEESLPANGQTGQESLPASARTRWLDAPVNGRTEQEGLPANGRTGQENTSGESNAPPATDATAPERATTAAGQRHSASAARVRGLTLRRGRSTVLHDIDLDVGAGEFVAIVGANGAGKTSLIQAIAGVIPAPRGTVTIGGVDIARADPRRLSSRIGFVFQNPEHQFIAHTVFDELAHGLRMQRLPDTEVRARTAALLARFGLSDKASVHPFLLSGGQKRRLSVGTALVAGAPVLALDEPTFGQDRARADELLSLLRDLNDEGTTIIVVTHDMQLVTEYADSTVVMADGRILAHGTTADVFADEALIARAGLRLPPLQQALRLVTRHPELSRIARLADLPATPRARALDALASPGRAAPPTLGPAE